MKSKRKSTHRGELLRKAVQESPVKITMLVKRLGISRGTYYNHIEDPDLSFEVLEQYGEILHYDFAQEIPEMKKYMVQDPGVEYRTPKTLDDALEQIDYWRNKYIKLLEEVKNMKRES